MNLSSIAATVRKTHDAALESFKHRDQGESRATRIASGFGEIAGGLVATIPVIGAPVVAALAGIEYASAKASGENPSIAGARIGTWAIYEGVACTLMYAALGPIAALATGAVMASPSVIKGFTKIFTR